MQAQTSAQLELDIFQDDCASNQKSNHIAIVKHQKSGKKQSESSVNIVNSLVDSLQTVAFLPLAQIFERHGAFFTLNYAQEQLLLAKRIYKKSSPLYIAVDRWRGSFLFSNYATLLGELLESAAQIGRFKIVGPTTTEILDIIGARSETTCHISFIREVLRELANNGISELSGGSDLLIHKIASEANFSISVSQRVDLVEIEQNKLNYLSPSYIRDLLFVKNYLCKEFKCKTWFLWCGRNLDSLPGPLRESLTPKLLRLISIARAILPPSVTIKSSISSQGLSFVREALDIGAKSCGYLGLDQNSASNLGLITRNEIDAKVSQLTDILE